MKKISPQLIFFLIFQILINLVIFVLRPETKGLYTFYAQLTPLIAALPLLFLKKFREHLSHQITMFLCISFAFMALDYLTKGHIGIIQLAVTFTPSALLWLFLFGKWNVYHCKQKKSLQALALSIIAWGFMALSFPPLPLGPGAVLFLVPWFLVLWTYPTGSALFATFWSGIVYNAINYYWIHNVMKVGPAGFILLGLFLLIAFFSAYNVLAAYVFSKAKNIKLKGIPLFLLLYPVFYAGLEMTRTKGDFSFPWSHLGYTFGNHLELLQMLPKVGIFGYTIFIITCNMVVAYAFLKRRYILTTIPAIALLLLFIQGTVVLSSAEATPFCISNKSKAPMISLVQPSIPQTKKWSRKYFNSVVTKTKRLMIDSIPDKGVDLVLLAETALPDFIKSHPAQVRDFRQLTEQKHYSIFLGALDYDRITTGGPRTYKIYNAGFWFPPKKLSEKYPYKRYIKEHLVPFSERIPFDDIFPILNYVNFGQGNFITGNESPVYSKYKWTPFICYDAIYGDLVRKAIRNGSRLMVNITNDGWFGISTAPSQHLNLIRYRAITNAYPVARVANSGISTFIDTYGHYSQKTDLFTTTVLTKRVPLRNRTTLYTRIGDFVENGLLIFFVAYLLLLFVSFFFLRHKTTKQLTK